MNRCTNILAFLTAVVCAGCAPSVDSVMFLSPPPAPRSASHPIQLYQGTQPECPFQEVGTVMVKKDMSTMERMTESLRRRAREMGGDAVIKVSQGTVNGGGVIVGSAVVADNNPVVTGTVVRFKDPACTH